MVESTISMLVKDLLEDNHVKTFPVIKIEGVFDKGAITTPTDGGDRSIVEAEARKVIMSIRHEICKIRFHRNIKRRGNRTLYQTGDCKKVGNVYTVVHGAYEIARML